MTAADALDCVTVEPSVTVIVVPRERFSTVLGTLDGIRATVPSDVPVIVVEGGSPGPIRRGLRRRSAAGGIDLVSHRGPIVPNRARNDGAERARTEFLVFVDNDMVFEPGWLEALVRRAVEDRADVVAPLICIGPPRAAVIHHAGGQLRWKRTEGREVLGEDHRLKDVEIDRFDPVAAPPENMVAEFHCVLMRRSLWDRLAPLDERLVTREQMDLALRCLALGARVRFEADAVVTYFARIAFSLSDLRYHLFRWSDPLVMRSLEVFERTWGVDLDRERVRDRWIGNHRRRAIDSALKPLVRHLPGRAQRWVLRLATRALEARGARDAVAAVGGPARRAPDPGVPARALVVQPPLRSRPDDPVRS